MKYRVCSFLLLFMWLSGILGIPVVFAAEEESVQEQIEEELRDTLSKEEYREIEQAMEELTGSDEIHFLDLVKKLASADFSLKDASAKEVLGTLFHLLTGKFDSVRSLMTQILVLSILSALFSMISSVFGNGQVSDIGFYVVFLILIVLLLHSFRSISMIAEDTIGHMVTFVKLSMPAYMMMIAAAGAGTTAVLFYEFFLFLVFVVQWLFGRLVLPLIHMYVILGVVNHLTKEDYFSKTAELLKTAITWMLKTVIGLVIGFQLLQSLVAPYIDSFKSASLHKTLMSIPGVGNAVNGVTEMALGAGILIKNGMGAAVLVVLVLICLVPVLSLGAYGLMYQLVRALIQPVADKRILAGVGCVKEGAFLLLRTVLITCFLFLMTIAVLTATTNIGMG